MYYKNAGAWFVGKVSRTRKSSATITFFDGLCFTSAPANERAREEEAINNIDRKRGATQHTVRALEF